MATKKKAAKKAKAKAKTVKKTGVKKTGARKMAARKTPAKKTAAKSTVKRRLQKKVAKKKPRSAKKVAHEILVSIEQTLGTNLVAVKDAATDVRDGVGGLFRQAASAIGVPGPGPGH